MVHCSIIISMNGSLSECSFLCIVGSFFTMFTRLHWGGFLLDYVGPLLSDVDALVQSSLYGVWNIHEVSSLFFLCKFQ